MLGNFGLAKKNSSLSLWNKLNICMPMSCLVIGVIKFFLKLDYVVPIWASLTLEMYSKHLKHIRKKSS